MMYLIGATTDQFAALKAAAQVALVGIPHIVKHRPDGAIDVFSREGDPGQWSAENAVRVHAFVLGQGLIGPDGELPRKDTTCYTGLRFVHSRETRR